MTDGCSGVVAVRCGALHDRGEALVLSRDRCGMRAKTRSRNVPINREMAEPALCRQA
jgi:hypothetical protein